MSKAHGLGARSEPLPGRQLPPLDLLRGFEAAARHLSFSRAAKELFLTQSAISRQIINLEEKLGTSLFVRAHRTLALTPAGQDLYAASVEALERIREVTARIRAPLLRPRVTLTTVPGFASLWLIPRLARFARIAPLVDVRISVSLELVDLEHDEVDIAVRYCTPQGMRGQILFEEHFEPVCAPDLARDSQLPLGSIADLARHTFLDLAPMEASAALVDWDLWLRSVSAPEIRPARTLSFSHYDEVIAAAIAGQGVAIGRLPLINEYLADGRLLAPFSKARSSAKAYVLVESSHAANNPAAQLFASWLREETGHALNNER